MDNQDISIGSLFKFFLRNIRTVIICCVAALVLGVALFGVSALSPVAPSPVESSVTSPAESSDVTSEEPELTVAEKVAEMTHSDAIAFLEEETLAATESLEEAQAKLDQLGIMNLEEEYTARTVQYVMAPSEAVASLMQGKQPLLQYLYQKFLFDGTLREKFLAENGIEVAYFFDWHTTIEVSNWIITVTKADIGPNTSAYSAATDRLLSNARSMVAGVFGEDFLSEIYETEFTRSPRALVNLKPELQTKIDTLTLYISELEAAYTAVPEETSSAPASSSETSSDSSASNPSVPAEANGFRSLVKYVAVAVILGLCVAAVIVYVRFTRSKTLIGAEQLANGYNILATGAGEPALADAASVGVLAIIGKSDTAQKSIGVIYDGVNREYASGFSKTLAAAVGCNTVSVENCFASAERLKTLMECDNCVALFEEGKTSSDFVSHIAQLTAANPGMYLGCAVVKAPVTEKK